MTSASGLCSWKRRAGGSSGLSGEQEPGRDVAREKSDGHLVDIQSGSSNLHRGRDSNELWFHGADARVGVRRVQTWSAAEADLMGDGVS